MKTDDCFKEWMVLKQMENVEYPLFDQHECIEFADYYYKRKMQEIETRLQSIYKMINRYELILKADNITTKKWMETCQVLAELIDRKKILEWVLYVDKQKK